MSVEIKIIQNKDTWIFTKTELLQAIKNNGYNDQITQEMIKESQDMEEYFNICLVI